jgi:hypothetical protein
MNGRIRAFVALLALVRLTSRTDAAESEAANRVRRIENFKQLAEGMHLYHEKHQSFPAAANYDSNGKPLLSWRVHILPFLGEQKLYEKFHLDEPWDSEHNRKLALKMPRIFADPDPAVLQAVGDRWRTTVVVPTGATTAFHGHEGTIYQQITDGTSATILFVEVIPERAVIWTQPEDWEVDFTDPLHGVQRDAAEGRSGFAAAFCDGSVHWTSADIDPKVFAAQVTRAGED